MEYIILAGAIVLVIVLIMVKEYFSSISYRNKVLHQIYLSYGTPAERSYKAGEMEHIGMYYHKHTVEHQIDDITWNDLDMDSIYQTINVSCSASGD